MLTAPMTFDLAPYQWMLMAGAATGSGLGKTGIPGMNVLSVSLFALALPPRASTGIVLPILICADLAAVATFRQQADWEQLRRLFPAAALGVVAGWAAMSVWQGDRSFSRLMGLVLLSLVLVQLWRKRHPQPEDAPQGFWWPTALGALAGFTTMVSNAAGPLLILYLLGRKLPKMALMGTAAWFFCCLNLFKLPFSIQMGLINAHSLPLDLWRRYGRATRAFGVAAHSSTRFRAHRAGFHDSRRVQTPDRNWIWRSSDKKRIHSLFIA